MVLRRHLHAAAAQQAYMSSLVGWVVGCMRAAVVGLTLEACLADERACQPGITRHIRILTHCKLSGVNPF